MDDLTTSGPVSERRVKRRFRIAVGRTLIVIIVVVVVASALQQIGVLNLSLGPSSVRLAVIDPNGQLVTMDGRGGSIVSYGAPGTSFQFPAWSPDGLHIAAIGTSESGGSVDVFTVATTRSTQTDGPVMYLSADWPPFYLYWRPDGRAVTFLTTEATGIALRMAPADGSQTDVIVHEGSPLYWDFADQVRILIHSGTGGGDGFLGEVDLAGVSKEPTVLAPGHFRAPTSSTDLRYRAFVAPGNQAVGTLVLEARSGSSRQTTPVFGAVALGFEPGGSRLAYIASRDATDQVGPLPVGPLRLIDPASGAVRTLIDGSEVAFFWAPDGKTIASLQVNSATGGGLASASAVVLASTRLAATNPGLVLNLRFVDVASGSIRAESPVHLSDVFVSQVLPFFDQYALSHRLWSSDSGSIALPLVGGGGVSQIFVIRADNAEARRIANGTAAFWSPVVP